MHRIRAILGCTLLVIGGIVSWAWATEPEPERAAGVSADSLVERHLSRNADALDHRSDAQEAPDAEPLRVVLNARDTLSIKADPDAVAQAMLEAISWKPEAFKVTLQMVESGGGQAFGELTFPSPRPTGHRSADRVHLDWYPARDDAGRLVKAPAVIVVHSLSNWMPIARPVARSVTGAGCHAFVLHLPGFGHRAAEGMRITPQNFATICHQAVADARRARDAVATLKLVDDQRIAIQGTSLGGFVASAAASLDGTYHRVFLLVSGADLRTLFKNGRLITPWIGQWLAEGGYTEEKLEKLLTQLEPANITHRLDPTRTWLFSAKQDQVIPPPNAAALAKAARLADGHHVWLDGDHFTFVLQLKKFLTLMNEQITAEQEQDEQTDAASEDATGG